jgi:hypothetical protein
VAERVVGLLLDLRCSRCSSVAHELVDDLHVRVVHPSEMLYHARLLLVPELRRRVPHDLTVLLDVFVLVVAIIDVREAVVTVRKVGPHEGVQKRLVEFAAQVLQVAPLDGVLAVRVLVRRLDLRML